jgi:hypothetical protein
VGATVMADARQNAGDEVMDVKVGDGGVPGEIDGGNVGNVDIAGNVNVFNIGNLEGNFDPPDVNQLTVTAANAKSLLDVGNAGKIIFNDKSPEKIAGIKATGNITTLQVDSNLTVTGDITAQSIGTIAGRNFLTGNNITTTGNIGSIDLLGLNLGTTKDRQATKVHTISCKQLGSVRVAFDLTANIRATNEIGSISVGGLVDAKVRQNGTFGDFIGSVVSDSGDVELINVAGNFDLPTDAPAFANLISSPGVIYGIQAGGDIGSTNSYTKSAQIKGNDIRLISSTGGSILLGKITASVGNAVFNANLNVYVNTPVGGIEAVLAKNILQAVLQTSGGSVGAVIAGTVNGNIRAEASNAGLWSPNSGADINYVKSTNLIPATVSFKADWYIGKIVVQNPKGDVEQFSVYAQGGQLQNANGFQQSPGALLIDVGKGTYMGKVRFTAYGGTGVDPVKTLGGLPAVFQPNTVLLTVKQTIKGNRTSTSWTLTGPAGQTTELLNVLFTELNNGAFGWVKKKSSFSNNQFSINGPSGNQG